VIREERLATTLVELADNLVDDFDVIELLTLLTDRCVEVLGVSSAGLMLAAIDGDLRVMASSSEDMRLLELFELQSQEGPCLDSFRSGERLVNQHLDESHDLWPFFAAEAINAGFLSVHAIPMRLRGAPIGVLNLFRSEVGELSSGDVIAAQAFADIATIAIIQQRESRHAKSLIAQLNHALESRIILEQAKGVLVGRHAIEMPETFTLMRKYARSNHLRMADVAKDIVDGSLSTGVLFP
jgi:GAF domain-containing protein